MNRRSLLRLGTLAVSAAALRRTSLAQAAEPKPVTQVLLVTKCHLDVGFTNTQSSVLQMYFEVYYPQAMRTAAALRQQGRDHYVWTTGSWLLYRYLEQANPKQRMVMEKAVEQGDITWHALPFNWQTEMLDRSMIEGALGFSAALDRRFGRTTIGAKMTDVPGHSRGLIAPLAAAGVRLLDIGVNAASTPPEVPDLFVWRSPGGASLAVMYHRHDYGSVIEIPGSGVAVDVEVRGDNSGPHTPEEIAAIYAKLRAQFPGASVQASDLNEVARTVDAVRDTLPVVTEEIGDTWIYGVASDPPKVARYRETARMRQSWLTQKRFQAGDAQDLRLLSTLLLAAEHTWGTDTKRYLDYDHYRPADLAAMLPAAPYQTMQRSWQEKRTDIADALQTLPVPLQNEARTRLSALAPARPNLSGMARVKNLASIRTEHFELALDPQTGAMTHLAFRGTQRSWASPAHPLALFTYQTLSAGEYADYQARYLKTDADWAPRDFGKPGLARFGAAQQEWHPRLRNCWIQRGRDEERLLLDLAMDHPAALASGNVAPPRELYLELRLPRAEARLDLAVHSFGKQPSRMPEAMWLTFDPVATDSGSTKHVWLLEKVSEEVAVQDVVRGGGRSMHAVSGDVRFTNQAGSEFHITSLDAPLVAVGGRSPLNFSLELPTVAEGVHFCFFNNAWGTNYLQWCGGDWLYRFSTIFT